MMRGICERGGDRMDRVISICYLMLKKEWGMGLGLGLGNRECHLFLRPGRFWVSVGYVQDRE